ncbi:MAG TPA: phosphatase PAP2 family protein [Spirochaetota bacterium]|mgnify:CR=1 FL=1|nr:phosphatase PAP2 family protein [Spirochaetota bacterium]HNT11545.1 phosphatase PAP2 family protein [Spirochaetota bacterium]HNV45892.1 phosphatase PAP2 family protein [Spirochaetota bacterium]HOS40073.1 phosphatase PAP2 family protein [Spirochaetota bacterium]HPI22175.1 phosphatase PAP2 family protein [Spirochaetota bacterium]
MAAKLIIMTAVSILIAIAAVIAYRRYDIPLAERYRRIGKKKSWKAVTYLGYSAVYIAPAAIAWLACTYYRPDPALAARALFVGVTVSASGIINALVKSVFGRYRPYVWFDDKLFGFKFFQHKYGFTSFPSGHSNTSFCAALVFSYMIPYGAPAFFVLAGFIAFSRVAINKHYLSDVLAGSGLGLVSAFAAYELYFRDLLA